jgi:hypothetical protein
MSGYGVKEARINREQKVRVNLCGSCGEGLDQNELLCLDCRGTVVGSTESEVDFETRRGK